MTASTPDEGAGAAAPVGFIGLGHMGGPMAKRLVDAGRTVLGSDPADAATAQAAADGVLIRTPAEIAGACPVVLLSLPSSDVVDRVAAALLDARGVLEVLVDTSSSVPERTRRLAEAARQHGVHLVDAPVSGGVPRARTGELTVMVGGDDADVARVRPLLDRLGTQVVAVGPVGAGHAVKALNNLLSAAHLLTAAEAILTAQRFGVAPERFLEVVNTSSGRSGSTELKLPRYVLPATWASGFSADLLDKDVRIAAELEVSAGLESALGVAVAERWAALNAELPRGADHTEIIKPLEAGLGVEARSAS